MTSTINRANRMAWRPSGRRWLVGRVRPCCPLYTGHAQISAGIPETLTVAGVCVSKSTISDCLQLLRRPKRACAHWCPASVRCD